MQKELSSQPGAIPDNFNHKAETAMEIRMQTNLIKVLALAASLTMAPTYAGETEEAKETAGSTIFHQNVDANDMKIAVIGSGDGAGDSESEHTFIEFKFAEDGGGDSKSEDTFIEFKSSEDGVAAIKKVIKTLSQTEWGDLNDQEKQALLATLEDLDDEMELEIAMDLNQDSSAAGTIAIIAFFGLPLLILVAVLYYKHRKRMIKLALVKDYLDAGKDVPNEVLAMLNDGESDGSANSFQSGVRNIAVGAGLFLFLGLLIDWGIASVALIPLFIGIGKLIVWRMNKDSSDNLAS
jgi:hypothetical protein